MRHVEQRSDIAQIRGQACRREIECGRHADQHAIGAVVVVEDVIEWCEAERRARTIERLQEAVQQFNEARALRLLFSLVFRVLAGDDAGQTGGNTVERADADMRREQGAGDSHGLRGNDRASQEVVRQDGISRLAAERIHRVGRVIDSSPE